MNRIFCNDIYYHKYNHRLFLLGVGDATNSNGYSTDDGLTWTTIPFEIAQGIAFSDSVTGVISRWGGYPYYFQYPFLYTSDGGTTWKEDTLFFKNGWQPLGIPGTKTFFAVGYYPNDVENFAEYTAQVKRSDDGGVTWRLLSNLPSLENISGMIGGTIEKLFIQGYSADGIMISEDQGITWSSICGPGCDGYPQRFYVKGNMMYVPDYSGNLWLNATGKANGPRLQLANKNIQAITGAGIPIQINYPNEAYYENVDSVTFRILHSGEMLGFNHAMTSPGWKSVRCTSTDSSVICVMKYIGSGQPSLNSPLATLYFNTYLSSDTSSTVTIDEVNFNQDTTYRDCMISALSASDTLHVSLDPSCGDSILRQSLKERQGLKIVSVHPNPASANITVDFSTAYPQLATIQILDELGSIIKEQKVNSLIGMNSQSFTLTPSLSGTFFIRITTGRNTVTEKFVKQ